MEKLDGIVSQAEILVNELVSEIEHGEANLQDAEQRALGVKIDFVRS